MKFEQKEATFQPVIIALETQAEVDTLRNILGGASKILCNQVGGWDIHPLFDKLDDITKFKCEDVRVILEE